MRARRGIPRDVVGEIEIEAVETDVGQSVDCLDRFAGLPVRVHRYSEFHCGYESMDGPLDI